jgi:hypothetical protein
LTWKDIETVVKEVICPRCQKKSLWEGNPYRPFCSLRCKLADLGAWIKENYVIEGEEKLEE